MSVYENKTEIMEAISESLKEETKTDDTPKPELSQYKLGEEINNGVRYFGQEKVIKHNRTIMAICPMCDELWRVALKNVKFGSSKSCGCTKRGCDDK